MNITCALPSESSTVAPIASAYFWPSWNTWPTSMPRAMPSVPWPSGEGSPATTLALACVLFIGAAIATIRVPQPAVPTANTLSVEYEELHTPTIVATAWAFTVVRGVVGFFVVPVLGLVLGFVLEALFVTGLGVSLPAGPFGGVPFLDG